MSWLLFYASIPLLCRIRRSQGYLDLLIGWIGDLFVIAEIGLLSFFSTGLSWVFGLLFHLYLCVDSMLFQKMGLRMRPQFLYCIKDAPFFLSSFQKGQVGFSFFVLAWIVFTHVVFFYKVPFQGLEGYGILLVLTGALLTQIYQNKGHNSFLELQINKILSFQKQTPSSNILKKHFSFSGPKLLENVDKPHIVFLFLESFGQNVLAPQTTPCFDRLMKEGLFFSQFYASGTLTYRAMLASLFSIPAGSTSSGLKPYLHTPFQGMPAVLKQEGYKTAFFKSGSLGFDFGGDFFKKHFDEVMGADEFKTPYSFSWGIDDRHLMFYASDWLEKQENPAFLSLLTVGSHHPWILPPDYFAPSFGYAKNSYKERFLKTIHFTDFCLGQFIHRLKEKNLMKKTIIFVLGDHGQPLGEHKNNFHSSSFLYEENMKVPLLILGEGLIETPKHIETIGSQLDLFPTVVDLLNLQIKHPHLGDSLLRPVQEKTIFFHNPYCDQKMGCRKGDWKWIDSELYHLKTDPEEAKNLSHIHPEISLDLAAQTKQFVQSVDAFYRQHALNLSIPSSVHCDFSNTLVTDQELVEKCPSTLEEILLHHCMLLTEQGILSMFRKCPHLKRVSLLGITEIGDNLFGKDLPKGLEYLNVSSALFISDQGYQNLIKKCPKLFQLSISGKNLTDEGLNQLGSRFSYFKLSDAPCISETGLLSFLAKNQTLNELIFEECPHVTDQVIAAIKHHPLEFFGLYGPSLITEQGMKSLKEMPFCSSAFQEIVMYPSVLGG